jgi:dTDP-4-dehydrorhamnose reductase
MKIAIIGANGQLGSDLCKQLSSEEIIALSHEDVEITDMASVKKVLEEYVPDTVINTAAFHRVDDCETEQDKAFSVNALGTKNVAIVSQQIQAKLVHIGTDYIFGGEAEARTIPYTEFDTPVPASVYGRSKLAGEDYIRDFHDKYFIIRASGLFGVAGSSGKGGNFVETMLRLGKERDKLTVVNDQIFSPTFTKDLASKIAQLITTEYYGIFHVTNSDICSWYEFSMEILFLAGIQTPVIPITSDQYPQKARRPDYSVLGNYHLKLLGMDDMRNWREALKDYMTEKGHIG